MNFGEQFKPWQHENKRNICAWNSCKCWEIRMNKAWKKSKKWKDRHGWDGKPEWNRNPNSLTRSQHCLLQRPFLNGSCWILPNKPLSTVSGWGVLSGTLHSLWLKLLGEALGTYKFRKRFPVVTHKLTEEERLYSKRKCQFGWGSYILHMLQNACISKTEK